MKALSVKQPWASLIASGKKKIECRSWNTRYRGELLICSSKINVKKKTDFFCGKALVVVDLVDVRNMTLCDLKHSYIPKHLYDKVLNGYAWVINKKYEIIPFPVKGKLNFFEVESELIAPVSGSYLNHSEYSKEFICSGLLVNKIPFL